MQKVNLQEHVYTREHIAQVKSLLENGGINCLTDQQLDKSPSVTPTPQTASQTVATTASIIGGLYSQYLLQQNNSQQMQTTTANINGTGLTNPTCSDNMIMANHQNFHQNPDQDDAKGDKMNSSQDQQPLMENNLLLQINADKQSTTSPSTNSEILQQLYNYSQMSGELIK